MLFNVVCLLLLQGAKSSSGSKVSPAAAMEGLSFEGRKQLLLKEAREWVLDCVALCCVWISFEFSSVLPIFCAPFPIPPLFIEGNSKNANIQSFPPPDHALQHTCTCTMRPEYQRLFYPIFLSFCLCAGSASSLSSWLLTCLSQNPDDVLMDRGNLEEAVIFDWSLIGQGLCLCNACNFIIVHNNLGDGKEMIAKTTVDFLYF